MLSSHLVDEQDVEAQPKSDDEDDEDDGKLGDSMDDVVEHEDEDAKVGDIAKVLERVEPGEGDEEGSNGPLPTVLTFAACSLIGNAQVKDEDEGGEVENPVDKIGKAKVSGRKSHIELTARTFAMLP